MGTGTTYLNANCLVPKTHPRIAFRGALDSLEADILEAQLLAAGEGEVFYRDALGEILRYVRELMSAEVNGRPAAGTGLFGLSPDELHDQSHRVREVFGFPHPIPDYTMGALALRLNTLRTRVRETELAAARAFPGGEADGGIVLALNRLSSALWWLFCRRVKGA